jgi:hypothetical protein
VWHQGKRIEIARRLDALSNCYVKRNKNRVEAGASTGPVPEGLSMRDLERAADDDDDVGSIF